MINMMEFLETGLDMIWKESGSIIGLTLAGAIGYFVPKASSRIKTYIHQHWFKNSLKKSIELKIKLAELKTKIGAQRVYMLQFHNGKVFLGDNGFHKYSISAIFEIAEQGLSREIHNMQSIPMGNYAELLYYMQNEDQDIA